MALTMLRMTEYIRDTLHSKHYKPFNGTILIWNLTNACNLYCKHCYSSANQGKREELVLSEIRSIAPDLHRAGVRFAILSGGEPLLRDDIFDIVRIIKREGIKTYLSTNGLLVKEGLIDEIKNNFDYVGISIDGEPDIHDAFRGKIGAFRESLAAIKLCLREGIKVGLRFTLTSRTLISLPFIFELVESEGIPRIYISHLVYSGRGKRLTDLEHKSYRNSMEFIIEKAFQYSEKGADTDIVTGNNEADAVLLLSEFGKRYPEYYDAFYERLKLWGGNQAGVRLANIDHKGNVKPDPFFFHPIGNVTERSFSDIWNSNGILSELRGNPRKIKGKCGKCQYLNICNGSSRARAYFAHGNYFAEDPACYI
jgi:radical SAM protein with 4Fe4S-binding SPASM domain